MNIALTSKKDWRVPYLECLGYQTGKELAKRVVKLHGWPHNLKQRDKATCIALDIELHSRDGGYIDKHNPDSDMMEIYEIALCNGIRSIIYKWDRPTAQSMIEGSSE